MIDPTADAESAEYRDGVIAGYHEFRQLLARATVLDVRGISRYSTGCKNGDWCRGWGTGYVVAKQRWQTEQAVHETDFSAGEESHARPDESGLTDAYRKASAGGSTDHAPLPISPRRDG